MLDVMLGERVLAVLLKPARGFGFGEARCLLMRRLRRQAA